jgi:hypothetical protein
METGENPLYALLNLPTETPLTLRAMHLLEWGRTLHFEGDAGGRAFHLMKTAANCAGASTRTWTRDRWIPRWSILRRGAASTAAPPTCSPGTLDCRCTTAH